MKILLTGKNGQVGFELQRALAPLGEIISVDQAECDLTNPEAIVNLVWQIKPEVIVNPAAYTAVDKAETDTAATFAVNTMAPEILGQEAAKLKALMVHYSTDYVFDGTKIGAYVEDDITSPQNIYGKSKAAGEVALAQANARHLILRTSWVVGAHGDNFAKTVLKLGAEREQLMVVADQFGAPTSAALLADITAQLVRQYQREDQKAFPYGIYHAVASGDTNWCDYARFVIATAKAAGKQLKLNPERIMPVGTAEYPTAAKRPANSRLATRRLRDTFGLYLPSWQDGLNHILQQLL